MLVCVCVCVCVCVVPVRQMCFQRAIFFSKSGGMTEEKNEHVILAYLSLLFLLKTETLRVSAWSYEIAVSQTLVSR